MPTVLESLNAALHTALRQDEHVIVLGVDILDPYGGAFKVTRGLSEAFPERVISTPVSEAGIVGLATGMAMRGLRPVVEIMFGDFITLAADQIVNHAAKFRWMYHDQVKVPLVIRTPMGGGRGYGATHSQSLEKLFLGIPGLRVLAPSNLGDPGALLLRAIQDEDPVLFIENKLLYPLPLLDQHNLPEFQVQEIPPQAGTSGGGFLAPSYAPTYILSIHQAPPPLLTVAAYGYMAEQARLAALHLAYEHEIFLELVVLTQLAPFELEPVLASTKRTHRLLVVEEGTHDLGWGAETIARAAEALGPHLQVARRLAALDLPIPASGPLEKAVLPGIEQIIESCRKITQKG